MESQWMSQPIYLPEGLVIDVRASKDGVTVTQHVDGVFASDLLLTVPQARGLAQALIEASAHSRGV